MQKEKISILLSDGRIVEFLWCDLFETNTKFPQRVFTPGWYYKGTKYVYKLFFNNSKDKQIELKVLNRNKNNWSWNNPKKFHPKKMSSLQGNFIWY
jgi:hypothetical protein